MLVEELSRDRKGTIRGASEEGVEHYEGLTEVGLVFLVMKTNTERKRWSTAAAGTTAVSQDFEKRWLGFVKLVSYLFVCVCVFVCVFALILSLTSTNILQKLGSCALPLDIERLFLEADGLVSPGQT